MSGGGTGLISGGGASIGSGGRGKSGFAGCSIISVFAATTLPLTTEIGGLVVWLCELCGLCADCGVSCHTSRPIARMSANALLCSTTPGRIR